MPEIPTYVSDAEAKRRFEAIRTTLAAQGIRGYRAGEPCHFRKEVRVTYAYPSWFGARML